MVSKHFIIYQEVFTLRNKKLYISFFILLQNIYSKGDRSKVGYASISSMPLSYANIVTAYANFMWTLSHVFWDRDSELGYQRRASGAGDTARIIQCVALHKITVSLYKTCFETVMYTHQHN